MSVARQRAAIHMLLLGGISRIHRRLSMAGRAPWAQQGLSVQAKEEGILCGRICAGLVDRQVSPRSWSSLFLSVPLSPLSSCYRPLIRFALAKVEATAILQGSPCSKSVS